MDFKLTMTDGLSAVATTAAKSLTTLQSALKKTQSGFVDLAKAQKQNSIGTAFAQGAEKGSQALTNAVAKMKATVSARVGEIGSSISSKVGSAWANVSTKVQDTKAWLKLAQVSGQVGTAAKTGAYAAGAAWGATKTAFGPVASAIGQVGAAVGKVSGPVLNAAKSTGAAVVKMGGGLASSLGKLAPGLGALTIGLAGAGAAVVGFGALFSKAIDSQPAAMARLNAITARFNLGLKNLFKGVDTKPFLNSLDRMAAMFDANTATGRVMGKFLSDVFKGVGDVVTALTPVAEEAFGGILIIGMRVQRAFVELQTAAYEIGTAILDSIPDSSFKALGSAVASVKEGFTSLWNSVSRIGEIFRAVGNNGTLMNGIFSAGTTIINTLGGALDAAGVILGGLIDVIVGVLSGDATKAFDGLKTVAVGAFKSIANTVLGAAELIAKAIDAIAGTDLTSKIKGAKDWVKELGKSGKEGQEKTKEVGASLGDGMVKGMEDKNSALYEAGKRAAKEVIRGAKDEAEVKSPSRKMRNQVGLQMAKGVALGIEDGGPQVDKAARDNLVPNVDPSLALNAAARSGSSGGSGKGAKIFYLQPGAIVIQGTGNMEKDAREMLRNLISDEADEVIDTNGGAAA